MLNFKEFMKLDEIDKKGLVTFVQQAATVPQLIKTAPKAPKLMNFLAQTPNLKQLSDILTSTATNPANDAVFAKANDPTSLLTNLQQSAQKRGGDFKSFVSSLDQNQLGLLNQAIATKNFNTFTQALKDPQKQTQFLALKGIFEKNPQAAAAVKAAAEKLMMGNTANKPTQQAATPAKPGTPQPAAQPNAQSPAAKPGTSAPAAQPAAR